MRWVEVEIKATAGSVDAASNVLVEAGCSGAVVDPGLSSASEQPQPIRVMGYLPVDDRLEERLCDIRSRIARFPEHGLALESEDIAVKWVEDQEWATAWKKHFKPIKVGRVVVKPSWEPFSAGPDEVVIDIDPGMAFGTGYHPTTQLCLQALQERIKGGENVLDMGTGSGVLAIAAARLGASSVVGLDADTVAVEVGQENVTQAGLSDIVRIGRADSPLAFAGQADLIVANILAQVLIDMAGDLAAKLKPGGLLISSGIIAERADDVGAAFEAAGMHTVETKRDGDWVALVSERAG